MAWEQPAFEASEYQSRMQRAQQRLKELDLSACVCIAPEHLFYLVGYEAHTHFSIQALIFGAEHSGSTLVLRDVDRGSADIACVRDIQTYHLLKQDPAELIASALDRLGVHTGRVGIGLNTYALPGSFALHLVEALRPREVVDVTSSIEKLRYVKSAREMEYVRQAAALAELGLVEARRVARPGMTEIQLAGRIEAVMREAGSEYSAMPTWIASGPRTGGSHETPTQRVIQAGDGIKMEFAGVCRRYHAVTMQTLWVGEPKPEERRVYEVSLAGLMAGAEAARPGVPVRDVEAAAFMAMRDAGFDLSTHFRFGYGVGIAFPPTWLEGLDIIAEAEDIFEPNMSFVLHDGVVFPNRFGTLIGGAYVMSETGLECLSGGALELIVV